MRQPAKMAPAELDEEKTQLVNCRRAFFLLSTGIVLHLFSLIASPFLTSSTPDEQRTEELVIYALDATTLLLTIIPASVFLWWSARSDRWRWSARLLLLTAVVNLVVVVSLAAVREPGKLLVEPEPLGIRVLLHSWTILVWLQFWWIAILVAEFSLASKSNSMVSSTEYLGYMVLAGLAAALLYAAWDLPSPLKPGNTPDSMRILLILAQQLLILVVLAWEFEITWLTSALARVLASHCDELKTAELSRD